VEQRRVGLEYLKNLQRSGCGADAVSKKCDSVHLCHLCSIYYVLNEAYTGDIYICIATMQIPIINFFGKEQV